MYTVIIAHAPNLDLAPYLEHIRTADLLIAADGGALPLLRANILPHIAVGDFDSLDTVHEQYLIEQNVEVQHFPRAKDETDLELALMLAAQRGANTIDILGALGGRWDHTLANVALLDHPTLRDRQVRLLADQQTLFLVRDTVTITGQKGDTISLLPLTGTVHGVTTEGLLYPLRQAILHYEQARGISNVLITPPGLVRIKTGLLLIVHHDDGGAHQWNTG
ncbi:MAG: Thiamine pyrophosphokinase [Chloroflexi bacterium AL-W]|nr:Thiamine pyrophosphokinase [Chloroflexi bacterium AL-N1]NOK66296.1 Thiamine pyrophosphokinase [Chloroflexi bacterium AL-N10]NOK73176.1 Thiamine pyrophosphokinase [Chloroflexi bacterium AL-N5]NOK80073.1 Thiamine pyrophosphokinase [Chloroflexi bacterium AL-W]NOK88072.1 Thiamine pyrophosphokinase [Chloroflexi bacterium AL-N15]